MKRESAQKPDKNSRAYLEGQVRYARNMVLIILLMTPKTSTLPYLAFQYQNSNSPQASDCVAIVMFSIVFLVYALANIFGDADLAKSMGG